MKKDKVNKTDFLKDAKRISNDEFYTYTEDIKKELDFHIEEIKGKTVYCCCDDPRWSNFFKYLFENYKKFELKGLIASHYLSQQITMFEDLPEKPVFCEYYGEDISYDEFIKTKLKKLEGDGDVRRFECVNILKKCDLIITNPPFSIINDIIKIILDYKKEFLMIAPMLSFTYIYNNNLFIEKRIKVGKNIVNKFYNNNCQKDLVVYCLWATNLKTDCSPDFFYSGKNINEIEYDKLNPLNGEPLININIQKDIPDDYYGLMAVPVTFITFLNLDQFKCLGTNTSLFGDIIIDGKFLFKRLIIKRIKK